MTENPDIVVLRDPKGLWSWLRGFLIAYVVVTLSTAVLSTAFLQVSRGDPNYIPADFVGINLTLGLTASALFLVIVYVTCIFLTVRVTYRMVKNAHALNSPHASIGPGWAAGSYFVPFANLYIPVKAIGEVWRATFADLEGEPPREPRGAIGWWWAFWIVGNLADNGASRLTGSGIFQTPSMPSPVALMAAQVLTCIGAVSAVAATIFMIRLFGALTRAQTQLVEKHG